MIIRWGRKGLVAAAFAVAFVTPSATNPTSINKIDLRPSYKQVVRYVTPLGVTPLPEIKDGVYRGYQIQEEDELLAMIAMAFIEMVE